MNISFFDEFSVGDSPEKTQENKLVQTSVEANPVLLNDQYWALSARYELLAEDQAKLLVQIEELKREKELLESHNKQCRIVVAAVVDVYDIVLPYKILKKARELLGRER